MALFAEHFSVASPLSPAEIVARLRPLVLPERVPFMGFWLDGDDLRYAGEVTESSLRLRPLGFSRHALHQLLDAQIEQTQNGSEVHCRIGPPTAALVLHLVMLVALSSFSCCLLPALFFGAPEGKADWSTAFGATSVPLLAAVVYLQSWVLGRGERAALRTFVTTELSRSTE